MGLSAFMLLLFLIYSFGLSGMCARRTHQNYKQTCHRGVSANCLLTGVSFYFIFSWVILVVCLVLYIPGILSRHLICSPVIELDDSKVISVCIYIFSSLCQYMDYWFLIDCFLKFKDRQKLDISKPSTQSTHQSNEFQQINQVSYRIFS